MRIYYRANSSGLRRGRSQSWPCGVRVPRRARLIQNPPFPTFLICGASWQLARTRCHLVLHPFCVALPECDQLIMGGQTPRLARADWIRRGPCKERLFPHHQAPNHSSLFYRCSMRYLWMAALSVSNARVEQRGRVWTISSPSSSIRKWWSRASMSVKLMPWT